MFAGGMPVAIFTMDRPFRLGGVHSMFVNCLASFLLAFVNVAGFLCCLGSEARHPHFGVPVWLLLLAGAILPLLGCVFCFYLSLSVGTSDHRLYAAPRRESEKGLIPSAGAVLVPAERETVAV